MLIMVKSNYTSYCQKLKVTGSALHFIELFSIYSQIFIEHLLRDRILQGAIKISQLNIPNLCFRKEKIDGKTSFKQ